MENERSCESGHLPLSSHGISRRPGKRDRALVGGAIAVTGLVMGLELAGGLLSGSLSLMSDSFHMFTHFLSLGIALGAMFIAAIPRDHQRSFGLFRAEVLAALINGFGLIPLAGLIIYEAYERIADPTSINVGSMLPIAALGLVSNIVTAVLLFKVQRHDLNLKGAIMHMFADMVSSIAVLGVGVLLLFTDLYILDPIVSVGIAVLILVWSGGLIRDTLRILLEIAPKGLDMDDVREAARCIDGVTGLHDIHAWEITSGMVCLTAHVDVDPGRIDVSQYPRILKDLRSMMLERFGIVHTVFELCPTLSD